MWRPDSGTSPNRGFVLVSDDVHREYKFRWRQIQPLVWNGAHPADIECERDKLRSWVRMCALVPECAGLRIIPT